MDEREWQRENKREGEKLTAKHIKTPFLDVEAMGNTVWSKCLNQAERERI